MVYSYSEALVLGSLGLCVRGLGDSYTGQFRYVAFPTECAGLQEITVTHDPAGAFHPEVRGIVFAGHTHCGQIRIPLLGALFVPTKAPEDARCGLFRDERITLFVSSGIGTSVIPIRFLAQAQWDLININNSLNAI